MLSNIIDSLFKRKYSVKETRVYPGFDTRGTHQKNSSNSPYEYSLSSTECSLEELLVFLGDVHMSVSAPPVSSVSLLDPTSAVSFSVMKHASSHSKPQKKLSTLISVLLTTIAEDGINAPPFPLSQDGSPPSSSISVTDKFSPGKVIMAIRDLVVFLGSVPSGYEIISYKDILPQDSALATMNIFFGFLIVWDKDFSKPLPFYEELVVILVELCHRLERIGSMIDHASSEVLKAVWNKAVAQTMQYVRNISVFITMQKIQQFDTIRCARSVSALVSMLATLVGCAAVTREWCEPSTASSVGLLFWSTADAVTDAILTLDSSRQFLANDSMSTDEKRTTETAQLNILSQNFIMGLMHSVFRSVSSAAPTPQEMMAGLGRLITRPLSVDYDRAMGRGIWIDSIGISNGNSVAHTIAGLMVLLRSGAGVSGDRMILPRHNEWMSAVSESLVFSFENGYKARDLVMLTPLLAELFFELCIRQSDTVPSIDAAYFELARFLSRYSELFKIGAKKKRNKKRKNKSKSGGSVNNNAIIDGSISVANSSGVGSGNSALKRNKKQLSKLEALDREKDLNDRKKSMDNDDSSSCISIHDDSSIGASNILSELKKKKSASSVGSQSRDASKPGSKNSKPTAGSVTSGKVTRGSAISELDELLNNVKMTQSNDVKRKSDSVDNYGGVSLLLQDALVTNKNNYSIEIEPTVHPLNIHINKIPPNILDASNEYNSNAPPRLDHFSPRGISVSKTEVEIPPLQLVRNGDNNTFTVGQQIDCQIPIQNGSLRWFPGTIVAVNENGTFDIVFHDGEKASNKIKEDFRVSKKRAPSKPGLVVASIVPLEPTKVTIPVVTSIRPSTSDSGASAKTPDAFNNTTSMSLSLSLDTDKLNNWKRSFELPPLNAAKSPDLSVVSTEDVFHALDYASRSKFASDTVSKVNTHDNGTQKLDSNDDDDAENASEDDMLIFTIPSVFDEYETAKRIQSAESKVPSMNLRNVNIAMTAAMGSNASQTSLSGFLVRDVDVAQETGNDDSSAESGLESSPERTATATSRTPGSPGHTYQYSLSSLNGDTSPDIEYNRRRDVPRLKNMKKVDSSIDSIESPVNAEQDTRRTVGSSGGNAEEPTTFLHMQPPKPIVPPLDPRVFGPPQARNTKSSIKKTNSTQSASGLISLSSNLSDTIGQDPDSADALARAYSFVALILLERAAAKRVRIDEKFCSIVNTVSGRSFNSSYFLMKGVEGTINSADDGFHNNIIFAVRDYFETNVDTLFFPVIATTAGLVDDAVTRLIKLLSYNYFDTCTVDHMNNAIKLAEGAFGSVHRVTCPISCQRSYCYSRDENAVADKESTVYKRSQTYAVKRVSRERSVHDIPVIIDIYNEITCLNMLSKQKGVCKLFNYGVYSGEYWLVMEEGKYTLADWRSEYSNRKMTDSDDLSAMGGNNYLLERYLFSQEMTVYMALFLDACAIIREVHDAGVCHFDLKCSNFILREDPDKIISWWRHQLLMEHTRGQGMLAPSGVMFVSDFGESIVLKVPSQNFESLRHGQMQTNNSFKSTSRGQNVSADPLTVPPIQLSRARGTLCIQSPEMLSISSSVTPIQDSSARRSLTVPHSRGTRVVLPAPSFESDLWSMGCMLVELISGSMLYGERPWPELFCLLCMDDTSNSIRLPIEKCFARVLLDDKIEKRTTHINDLIQIAMALLKQDPHLRLPLPNLISKCGLVFRMWDSSLLRMKDASRAQITILVSRDHDLSEITNNQSSLKYKINSDIGDTTSNIRVEAIDIKKIELRVFDFLASSAASSLIYCDSRVVCIADSVYLNLTEDQKSFFGIDLSTEIEFNVNKSAPHLYHDSAAIAMTDMLNRVVSTERCVSLANATPEMARRTLSVSYKNKGLTEIILVPINLPQHADLSQTSFESMDFKKKLRCIFVPCGGNMIKSNLNKRKTIHLGQDFEQGTYVIHIGHGEITSFLEGFQIALFLARKSISNGGIVVITVRSMNIGTSNQSDAKISGISTPIDDSPSTADIAPLNANDALGSKEPEMYSTSVSSKINSNICSQQSKMKNHIFTSASLSAMIAVACDLVAQSFHNPNFFGHFTAPVEKMAPWILRMCHRETLMYLTDYASNMSTDSLEQSCNYHNKYN